MIKRVVLLCMSAATAAVLFGQEPPTAPQPTAPPQGGFKQRQAPSGSGTYQVAPGTHILLNMINSVSTRQAVVGDRIYLETAFPVMSSGRIIIPQGSWVTGTVTEVKRPGRVKGRGELQVRFDSLTLPNGVTRDFRSDLGSVDPRDNETLKRENSAIKGPGNKAGDLGTVAETTTAGTVIGSGIGAAAGNVARGAGMGVGAGAAAGLLGVLMTRGPDATLSKGSTVEMVLDRPITFDGSDLDFGNAPPRATLSEGGGTQRQPQRRGLAPRIPY
jgi:type IV secretion system protein VirB10